MKVDRESDGYHTGRQKACDVPDYEPLGLRPAHSRPTRRWNAESLDPHPYGERPPCEDRQAYDCHDRPIGRYGPELDLVVPLAEAQPARHPELQLTDAGRLFVAAITAEEPEAQR